MCAILLLALPAIPAGVWVSFRLGFASVATTNSPEDFHLQAIVHAGHNHKILLRLRAARIPTSLAAVGRRVGPRRRTPTPKTAT